jgi:hypothetical protein
MLTFCLPLIVGNEMVYWDLDGCLRDLVSACTYDPQEWDTICHGMTLIEYVNQNLELLTSATPTEYLPIVADKEITILTVQPLNWIPYTRLWIEKHLPFANTVWCDHFEDKFRCLDDGDLLVEDYPRFKDNSRIIMIDRSYNRVIQSHIRVRTPAELKLVLEGL